MIEFCNHNLHVALNLILSLFNLKLLG